jgi:OOP family OmpA-OmpF porin
MKLHTAIIASLVLLAGTAVAQDDNGFYMGAGMGYSKLSIDEGKLNRMIGDGLPAPWTLTRSQSDESATPYHIFGGYRFMEYFAVELAYLNLGDATYKGNLSDNATTNPRSGAIKGTWSVDGVPLSLLGIWPISDQFDIFGRVGVFYGSVDLKARAKDSTGATIVSGSADDNTTEFFGGAGADWNFTDNLTGRAEWQFMPSVGNDDTGSGDFNNFIFSLIYRF